ncbi:mitochondrial ribosomal protein L28 [Halictus rubicundus]|uniref:mitochondrial ribosomal protein L28 n=1 Tax=Halictus rubicundus TaxID=77578 RepID=UPI004035D61C
MSTKHLAQKLYYMPRITRWSKGVGAALPEEYKKFWREWKLQEPTAVHYIKQEGKYYKDEKTGVVQEVQNIPIPLLCPKELHSGIWGGEAIIQGFLRKGRRTRRVPKFWFPALKKSVVYSEVLDTHMRLVVTNRTIQLIHEHYGFDHYLLKTPACDLKSELALKIKRQILLALIDKTLYPNDSEKKEEIFNKYKEYLTAYTREEIEWYGLTFKDAVQKFLKQQEKLKITQPLKVQYRAELIEKLKEGKANETDADDSSVELSSWMSKLNPFAKNAKTK